MYLILVIFSDHDMPVQCSPVCFFWREKKGLFRSPFGLTKRQRSRQDQPYSRSPGDTGHAKHGKHADECMHSVAEVIMVCIR